MSGGYKTPAKDDADAIKRHLENQSDAITILQRPTAAQLLQLVANSIKPLVGNAVSTYTWSTGYSTFAGFTFTIPAGCTRALIMAVGSATQSTNAVSGGEIYFLQTVINGVGGGETRALVTNTVFSAISASQAANLSGLTPGGSIGVSLQGHLTNGPAFTVTSANATISATALFLP